MPSRTLLHSLRKSLRPRDSFLHPRHDTYKWILLANVMIGTFMVVLDATIVNVGLPKIMASFGVGIDKIEWVITAYMLALAVMLPTSGWLADKFGYKLIYFWGLFLFTFGSALCGISGNENMLIISRAIQGLGGGMVQPLGMAIISREFPPEKRGIAMGFWVISAAASISFGPLIGGYLVDHFSWQLIFDVNIPVGAIGLFATFIIQEEYKRKDIKKFDLVGFISVTIFLPLMLYALSEGTAVTNAEGWSAPYILVSFAISIIALAVFITNEFIVEQPLIELRLLRDRNFGLANIIMFLFGVGVFGGIFLLPLYLQNSLNYTAYQSGLVFLPVGIIQGITAPIVGRTVDKINAKIPIVLGLLLLGASFYLVSWLSFLTERNYIMLSLYLRGFSMGMLFTALSTVSLYEMPREKMAQASGMLNTIRQLGGSLGVAIMATILSSRVAFHTQTYGQALQANSVSLHHTMNRLNFFVQHHAGNSPGIANKLSQRLLLGNINNQGYIQGIDDVFLIATAITLTAVIPALFLHGRKKKSQQPVKNRSNE
ncbi:MAG TPA: DHA2 family efflux MFS transporter permease subunit [Sunxiuqinia sp.]|nr:DHA2 family efflux MFS transporter permease subunit [Sunxiuqinia sp.]